MPVFEFPLSAEATVGNVSVIAMKLCDFSSRGSKQQRLTSFTVNPATRGTCAIG